MNYQAPQTFTPESIAQRFNLRRCGKQFQGACFLCGGRDRLWTTRGRNGQTLVRCRQCGDAPFKELTKNTSRNLVRAPSIQRSQLEYIFAFIKVYEGSARKGKSATAAEAERYRKYSALFNQADIHALAIKWGLVDE